MYAIHVPACALQELNLYSRLLERLPDTAQCGAKPAGAPSAYAAGGHHTAMIGKYWNIRHSILWFGGRHVHLFLYADTAAGASFSIVLH